MLKKNCSVTGLGMIVTVVKVNEWIKFGKICFNTSKSVANDFTTTTTTTPTTMKPE